MAKKIECDRCGKLVEEKVGCEVSSIRIAYTSKHSSNGYVKPDYDWEEENKTRDFCNSCQKELLKLFNKVDLREANSEK